MVLGFLAKTTIDRDSETKTRWSMEVKETPRKSPLTAVTTHEEVLEKKISDRPTG